MTMDKPSACSESKPACGPLSGVRVIDFCSFIAGSYGAMLLGDLGAEVIKVEPLTGDACRGWGPFLAGESRFFQGWNLNKRSLAVDLRRPEGLEVVRDLVRRADVAMENMRPGVTAKLGIDYESLSPLNSRLIYLSSTAFGGRGPYVRRPGYDPVLQSMGGAAQLNTRYSGVVAICSVAVSDYQAAMLAVSGVCAALYHRERTGVGQKIETSLLQAVMSVQSHFYIEALEREEEGAVGIYPYRMFDCADGPLFVAAGTDRFWRLFCEAIGESDLEKDPTYATNRQRVDRAAELNLRLEPILRGRGCREWESLLVEAGVPAAAVQTCLEFFRDPQVQALEMDPVIEHATIGSMRVAGVPIEFSETPGAIQRAAPLLGQHSREVLSELGRDSEAIDRLFASGVVAESVGEASQRREPAGAGGGAGSKIAD